MVTLELLVQHKLIRKRYDGVKVLGNGELKTKLVVQAHALSETAKSTIEAAGGRVEELNA